MSVEEKYHSAPLRLKSMIIRFIHASIKFHLFSKIINRYWKKVELKPSQAVGPT